ncbi:hypothetical protein GCM10009846_23430 [Agrococcus versicolor]|uniref:K Homology domain-containing protein n=1 Tax=Agrococcus versicolor TaxID=501482 RepID=A0ABN3AUL4_9MICO
MVDLDVPVVGVALVAVLLAAIALVALGGRRRRPRRPPRTAEVRLTTHARERMGQRDVDLADLERVVREPHRVVDDVEEGSVRLERDVGDDVLKVWVVAPWPPRQEVVVKSTAWQRVVHGRIPRAAVGAVVGHRGATVQALERRTGARVSIDRASGAVRVAAPTRAAAQAALREVEALARRA